MFVPATVCCSVIPEVVRIVELADTVVGILGLELDPVAEDRDFVVLAIAHPSKIGFIVMVDPISLDVSVFAPESCDEAAKQFIQMMRSSSVRCEFYPITLQDHPVIYAALLPLSEVEEVEVVLACRYLTGEAVIDNVCD